MFMSTQAAACRASLVAYGNRNCNLGFARQESVVSLSWELAGRSKFFPKPIVTGVEIVDDHRTRSLTCDRPLSLRLLQLVSESPVGADTCGCRPCTQVI